MGKILIKIKWYWHRLQCMSYSERLYRIKNSIHVRLEKSGVIGISAALPVKISFNKHILEDLNQNLRGDFYNNVADEVIEGKYRIFSK